MCAPRARWCLQRPEEDMESLELELQAVSHHADSLVPETAFLCPSKPFIKKTLVECFYLTFSHGVYNYSNMLSIPKCFININLLI